MRSITLKMIFAFLGLALLSIVIIVILVSWNTDLEFSRFVSDRAGTELVENLKNYYQSNGSWDGVEKSDATNDIPPRFGPGQPRGLFFTLADETGRVILPGIGFHHGNQIQQARLDNGIPIEVEGERVGTLIMSRTPFTKNPREMEFLRRVNMVLLYSALGATLLALFIGIFLSRTITRPIRELTQATQAIAKGNLGSHVLVRSKDELGELATSFNKMSADLARSTESRKQMTADIAHELRTPLSLIIGHADAVHDSVLPPTVENFNIIREEALRLEHMVNDLRTLSLADAGELSIHVQAVSAGKLLKDLQTTYQHTAIQKNIKIIVNPIPELPMLNIDPGRMTQVLTNILENALQHTPENSQIVLSTISSQDSIELVIQDSGPGLEGEDVNRIFNRFYRADGARNRDKGGSGLGLAIAKSIVQAHNGQIWAESLKGEGLKVHIKIPI